MSRFEIVEFTNPNGTISFRVKGTKSNGQRIRENFKERHEADSRKGELDAEALGVILKQTRLSDEQLRQAEVAFSMIGSASLLDVVSYWQKTYAPSVREITVADAKPMFIASRKSANRRERTVSTLDDRLELLVNAHGQMKVSEIQPEHLTPLIHRPGLSPRTSINWRANLSAFFNWCVDGGYCAKNPVEKIATIEGDDSEPEIFDVATVGKLLAAAEKYKKGKMVPYFALGFFCGIRPTELERLDWTAIDLKQRIIRLEGKVAKKRQRRIVEISKNAAAWLKKPADKKTPIVGKNWRRDFEAVRKLARVEEWPHDVLRHAAISHKLAETGDENKTAIWAGNSPGVIHSHYKGLVTQKETKAFWAIKP